MAPPLTVSGTKPHDGVTPFVKESNNHKMTDETIDRKLFDEKQIKVRDVRKGSWILLDDIPYKVDQHDTAKGSRKRGDPRGQKVRLILHNVSNKLQVFLDQNGLVTVLFDRPSPVNSPVVSTRPNVG